MKGSVSSAANLLSNLSRPSPLQSVNVFKASMSPTKTYKDPRVHLEEARE